jgi:predicted secreted protein
MSVVSEVNMEVQTAMKLVLIEMRMVQRTEDKMVKQKEVLHKTQNKTQKKMSVVSEVNMEVQTTMNLVLSEMRMVQRTEDKMVKQKEVLHKTQNKTQKKKKMEIFRNNESTTKKYKTMYLELSDKWNIKRKELQDKIISNTKKQIEIMSNETDDIGNPTLLCEELYKLRLEYEDIITQEKKEEAYITQIYYEQMCSNIAMDMDVSCSLKISKSLANFIGKQSAYEKGLKVPINVINSRLEDYVNHANLIDPNNVNNIIIDKQLAELFRALNENDSIPRTSLQNHIIKHLTH